MDISNILIFPWFSYNKSYLEINFIQSQHRSEMNEKFV